MSAFGPVGIYLLIVSTLSLLATAIGCWRVQVSQSSGHARRTLLWTGAALALALVTGTAASTYQDELPTLTCAEKPAYYGC
jgi:hypothetical protein